MAKPKQTSGAVPTGHLLSKHLRVLAAEACIAAPNGTILTRAERLAELIWQNALGWNEWDAKTKKSIEHEPKQWAMEMLYDRLEGRVPQAMEQVKGGSVADRVTELGKTKINDLVETPVEDPDEQP